MAISDKLSELQRQRNRVAKVFSDASFVTSETAGLTEIAEAAENNYIGWQTEALEPNYNNAQGYNYMEIPGGIYDGLTFEVFMPQYEGSGTYEAGNGDLLEGAGAFNYDGKSLTGTIPWRNVENDISLNGTNIYGPYGYYDSDIDITLADAVLSSPNISVSSNGTIKASNTLTSAGWLSSAPAASEAYLSTKAATIITPTTYNQNAVSKGYYTTGAITVKGDSNLVASNIASGKSIFGVSGTYSGDTVKTLTVSTTITSTTGSITFSGLNSLSEWYDYYIARKSVSSPNCILTWGVYPWAGYAGILFNSGSISGNGASVDLSGSTFVYTSDNNYLFTPGTYELNIRGA